MSEAWISAREALEMLSPGCKSFSPSTQEAICRRAAAGLVKSKVVMLVTTRGGITDKSNDCTLPKEFWAGSILSQQWQHGDFSATVNVDGLEALYEALGVTFERTGIEAMGLPSDTVGRSQQTAVSAQAMPVSATENRGGRPPYDWEAVMIELAGQLYEGALTPDRQATIEAAITKYFIAKGKDVSDSTVRDHARRLYQRLSRRDEN